jgi:hypothetical protein
MIGFNLPAATIFVLLFAGAFIYAKAKGFNPLDVYGSIKFHRILLVLMALYMGYIMTTC